MGPLNHKQLQAIITELDQAMYSHEHWYRNLLRVLISHTAPEERDLAPEAHRLCRFGLWCDSTSAAYLRDHPDFRKLEEAHENMHRMAGKLIRLAQQKQPILLLLRARLMTRAKV